MLGRYVKYAIASSVSRPHLVGFFSPATHYRPISLSHFQTKNLGKKQKENFIAEFIKEQPTATQTDIQQFLRYLKVVPFDQIYSHSHRASTLANKVLLIKMLQTPADSLSSETVKRTRDRLGFETVRNVFQDVIQLHLVRGGIGFTGSLTEAFYMIELSKKIEQATNINDLVMIYTNLKNSSYINGFRKGFACAESKLDFFILTKMNEEIHHTLYHECTNSFYFMSGSNVYQTQNKEEFEILKPVISTITSYLVEHNDHPDNLQLYKSIQNTKNETELVKALYTSPALRDNVAENDSWHSLLRNHKFKSWDYARSYILFRQEFFNDKSRTTEQLFLLLKDARKAGILFEFPEDLIKKYIAAQKHYVEYSIEHDDERISSSRYYSGLYGSYEPSDEKIRSVILEKMEEGLKQGKYQKVIDEMEWTCDWSERELVASRVLHEQLNYKPGR